MKHNEALEKNKFDTRLINWNLKRGLITEADLQEYKDSLQDCSTNARTVEIPMDEEINDHLN